MNQVITHCRDVRALRLKLDSLYNQGRYRQFIKKSFGRTFLNGNGTPGKTVVSTIGNESICNMTLSERDVIGDSEDSSYIPLVRALGLTVLSVGNNRGGDNCPYEKIKSNPQSLAVFQRFCPAGEGGRFNKYIEKARSN